MRYGRRMALRFSWDPRKAAGNERKHDVTFEEAVTYDFRGGVSGKYAGQYADGTNLILLDPELAAEFPDSRSVSRALKAYLKTKPKRRTA